MTATAKPLEELGSILKKLDTEEVELVLAAMKRWKNEASSLQPDSSALVQTLVGRQYSRAEKLELEIESLFRYFQRRRELLEDSITASQVAKLLGTSRQTPHDRVKSKTLLGVLDRGVYRFPLWQFDPEGADGVIDGLSEILSALSCSDFAKLNWFVRPNPFLDGLTPLQALKQGLQERVKAEAAAVGVR